MATVTIVDRIALLLQVLRYVLSWENMQIDYRLLTDGFHRVLESGNTSRQSVHDIR